MPSLPVGRAVPKRGFWEDVQESVAFGVYRWLEDGVWQRDSRLYVCGTGAPQGLVPREFGSGKIHLFQTVHGDDCGRKHREKSSFNKSSGEKQTSAEEARLSRIVLSLRMMTNILKNNEIFCSNTFH